MLEDIEGRNIGSRAGIELVRALLACGSPEEDKLGFLYCAIALLQNRSIGGLPPVWGKHKEAAIMTPPQ